MIIKTKTKLKEALIDVASTLECKRKTYMVDVDLRTSISIKIDVVSDCLYKHLKVTEVSLYRLGKAGRSYSNISNWFIRELNKVALINNSAHMQFIDDLELHREFNSSTPLYNGQ